MYKCYDCGRVIRNADNIIPFTADYGGAHQQCECGGPLGEAQECAYCGEAFLPDEDFSAPWCYACAQSAYTAALGLRFIKENGYEKNFTAYCYDIIFARRADERAALILFATAKNEIEIAQAFLRPCAESAALREFCLEDLDEWVDFLNYCISQKIAV